MEEGTKWGGSCELAGASSTSRCQQGYGDSQPTAGVLPIPPAALGKAVLAQEDSLISAQLLQQGMRVWTQESM